MASIAISAKSIHSNPSSKPQSLLNSPYFRPPFFHPSIRFRNPSKSPISRVLSHSIRASSQISDKIKPGNGVETDKLSSDVRNRAMDAVDSCGGRVTIGDVASKAGLKLNEAERALQALAADTGGFLEVGIRLRHQLWDIMLIRLKLNSTWFFIFFYFFILLLLLGWVVKTLGCKLKS